MKDKPERCGFPSALKGTLAQRATRNRLEYARGTDMISHPEENARVSDIKRARD
jgi:hypothetical protein